MNTLGILNTIGKGDLRPAYLINGPERFFADRILEKLKQVVLASPMGELSIHELDGGTARSAAIIDCAMQLPMMSSRILVIVENAHKMSAADHKAIETYLADPTPSTSLVLVGESFDSRRGLTKLAKSRDWIIEAAPLREADIGPFLKWRCKARGVTMSPGSMAAVAAAVGPEPGGLDDAVERLGLYVGPDREVDEAAVGAVVTTVRQHSVFELVDAIGAGQAGRALTLLIGLLDNQQEPIMINAMVARHFRQLLRTRIHMFLGTPERDMARAVGAPPFMVKKLVSQAKRFRGNALEQALGRLATADLELKSSRRPGSLVIESAVMDLCLPG